MPLAEDRIGLLRRLGKASYLHDFLVGKQTSANGAVNYGRPIGYAWIRARWLGNPDERPTERTLRRWMAILRAARLVSTQHDLLHSGMRVALIGSVKFAPERRPEPEQQRLFDRPVRFPQNPQAVEGTGPAKNGRFVRPQMAAQRSKEVKPKETISAAAAAETPGPQTPRPAWRPLTPPQKRYAQTAELIGEAQRMLARDAAEGRPRAPTDLAEELKCLAAARGFPRYGEMVSNAIDIAQRRLRDGRALGEGGWEDARAG